MNHFMMEKQKELMAKVPHTVRPDVYPKMVIGKDIIEKVLLYLNSCGHKPWRPNPLDSDVRGTALASINERWHDLYSEHLKVKAAYDEVPDLKSRQLISALGVIEETLEYLNSTFAGTREHQLEEITDILFFYLELLILGGFSAAEIEEEYVRKHAVNMKRYEDAKKGDYGWDKRKEGEL